MTGNTQIKHLNGQFFLSFQSPKTIGINIQNEVFDSKEELDRFLCFRIKKQVSVIIRSYIEKVTFNYQFVSSNIKYSQAINRLEKASFVILSYPLKDVCRFIIANNGIIELMSFVAPKVSRFKRLTNATEIISQLDEFAHTVYDSLLNTPKPHVPSPKH